MSRKLLAILMALIVSASLVACNNEEEETTENNDINVPTQSESEKESETEGKNNNGETDTAEAVTGAPSEIGDPGDYSYTECDQLVYVNNPNSAVTLRTEDYKAKGSVAHGTELRRIGLSTDEANYWSKVIYEEKEYYVATKFLTTLKDADEGFVEVDKVVIVNEITGSLNIRNLPTFDGSAIIGYALAGVETKVIAENTETGWYKIEFVAYGGEKTVGYIKSGAENFEKETGNETEAPTEAATATPTEAPTEVPTEVPTESAGK